MINEIELDGEQRLYVGYITESSGQMGVYIRTLIDISRTVAGYQLNLEEIDIAGYMEQIENIELNTELIKEIKKLLILSQITAIPYIQSICLLI